MKKAVLTAVTGLLLFALVACGQKTSPKDSGKASKEEFSKGMEESISENFQVKADFIYPDRCKFGAAQEAKVNLFPVWNRREDIIKDVFKEEVKKEYRTYDRFEEVSCERGDTEHLLITNNDSLSYSTAGADFILNTIDLDEESPIYNGQRYEREEDFAFMSRQQAWDLVKTTLDKWGVRQISEDYKCYLMDYKVMQEEEPKVIEEIYKSFGKEIAPKEAWSEEDNAYYFFIKQEWSGYSILPEMTGEGWDDHAIEVIVRKDGIAYVQVNSYYELEDGRQIEVQAPQETASKVKSYLDNIISEDTYTLEKVSLSQRIRNVDIKRKKAESVVVWDCQILSSYGEGDSYRQHIYLDAETLKPIQ